MNEIINRSEIERRLVDWKRRLDELYSTVEARAKASGLTVERSRHSTYSEWVIALNKVVPPPIEALTVRGNRGRIELTPRSFWALGVESIVDLWIDGKYAILGEVRPEPPSPPYWEISSTDKTLDGRRFDGDTIDRLLARIS